jgi:hypothetical protein
MIETYKPYLNATEISELRLVRLIEKLLVQTPEIWEVETGVNGGQQVLRSTKMSVKNDIETAEPIICGAIYRKEMPDKSIEFATMIAVIVKNSTTSGVLQRYGYSPERVQAGSTKFRGWKLYAEPGLIKAPKSRLNSKPPKREQPLA